MAELDQTQTWVQREVVLSERDAADLTLLGDGDLGRGFARLMSLARPYLEEFRSHPVDLPSQLEANLESVAQPSASVGIARALSYVREFGRGDAMAGAVALEVCSGKTDLLAS